jgi:hypothetical protein
MAKSKSNFNFKLILIFLVLIVGGFITYFFVFKNRDNNQNNDDGESEESCSDYNDENSCNNAVDSETNEKKCLFRGTRCIDIPVRPTCQSPDVVERRYRAGELDNYFYWTSSIDSNYQYGPGTNSINSNQINRYLQNRSDPSGIITNFGENWLNDACEFDEYTFNYHKEPPSNSCNFTISSDNVNINRYNPSNNHLSSDCPNLFFITANNCSNENEINSITDCNSIIDEVDCNNNSSFCLFSNNMCQRKQNLNNAVGYVCATSTSALSQCEANDTETTCPSDCQWNPNADNGNGKCLSQNYPIGDGINITPFYNIDGFDCIFDDSNSSIRCYKRV